MKNKLYKLFNYQKFQKEPELDSIISNSLEKIEKFTVKESDLSLVFGGRRNMSDDDEVVYTCTNCGNVFVLDPNSSNQLCGLCGEKVKVK